MKTSAKLSTLAILGLFLISIGFAQTSLDGDRSQAREKINEGLNLVIRGIQLVGFILAVGQGSLATLDYQRSEGKPGKREEALDKLKVSVIGAVGVVVIPELLKILLAPYVIGWFLG